MGEVLVLDAQICKVAVGFTPSVTVTSLMLRVGVAALSRTTDWKARGWRYSAACAGTMVTLSPQPHASVWFGFEKVNFECIGDIS